jgi:hypothetical protein
MASDLERALSKLRFDEQVLGYSLMTKVGRPFVSFSFPDELFPRVKDSIALYESDLRLMTIDTERGLVVLSPVDSNWILTVLYEPELQLGLAIAKTKNVLRLLEGIELPPPPDEFEESAESNLEVLESIAIQAASTETEPAPSEAQPQPATQAEPVEKELEEEAEPEPEPEEELKPGDFNVKPDTIPERHDTYSHALSLDSDLYKEMKEKYRNFGFDVLMLVDDKTSVEDIADAMLQPHERIMELLRWAAAKRIVDLPRAERAEGGERTMGRFVKCPHYKGKESKVDTEDRNIISLCDGNHTPEQIAEATEEPLSKVIRVIAKYRKEGLVMIGKTL